VEKVTQFLQSYQDRRKTSHYSIVRNEAFTADDVACMAAFHRSIVTLLTSEISRYALVTTLEEIVGRKLHLWEKKEFHSLDPEKKEGILKPLNLVEETRIMRALFRVQLYLNLFGHGMYRDYHLERLDLTPMEIFQVYIRLFRLWEIDQMTCIFAVSGIILSDNLLHISTDSQNQMTPQSARTFYPVSFSFPPSTYKQ
jgi:predicted nucleotidyltransferase